MNLNEEAILLYLQMEGRATREAIKDYFGVAYIDLLPTLGRLRADGVIQRTDGYYSVA